MRVTAQDLATSRERLGQALVDRGPVPVSQRPGHLWLVPSPLPDSPAFGGQLTDAGDELDSSPRRRQRGELHQRLALRARLYAQPATPCSALEVAWVFGLRESDVRAYRPATAQRCGRAILAPFAHWLECLETAGLLPSWELESEVALHRAGRPPRAHRRGSAAPKLLPLGGPGGS
jgi:hypothetical protein